MTINASTPNRRQWLLSAVATAAAASTSARADTVVQDLSWHDSARQRELSLRVRWPAGAGAAALVVHSHGLGGSRQGGELWGRAWQQAGFVVLHLQHPGSDSEVLREGVTALRRAANGQQLVDRALDVAFVLDQVDRLRSDASSPWARCARQRIGVAGHSFGAITTLAIAGQRFPAGARLADPRPAAFIALSPGAPNGLQPLQTTYGGIVRPTLVMTGSHDGDPFGSHTSGEPRARVFDGLPPGDRGLLWLEGADHMSFSGNTRAMRARAGLLRRHEDAVAREAEHQQAIIAASLLWWRAHLLADASSRAALRAGPALVPGDRWSHG